MAATIDPAKTYRCIVNSFAANASYFGSPSPSFVDGTVDTSIASLELRTLVGAALAGGSFKANPTIEWPGSSRPLFPVAALPG